MLLASKGVQKKNVTYRTAQAAATPKRSLIR